VYTVNMKKSFTNVLMPEIVIHYDHFNIHRPNVKFIMLMVLDCLKILGFIVIQCNVSKKRRNYPDQ